MRGKEARLKVAFDSMHQPVFFPTGLRVLPAGNLQISQEILIKFLIQMMKWNEFSSLNANLETYFEQIVITFV